MDPLAEYYIRKGGGGGHIDEAIGPVYVSGAYLQRGHGLGSFLAGLFRMIRPVAIRGARALGREAIHAGAQILTDIRDNKDPDTRVKDIVANRLNESAQRLLGRGKRRRREDDDVEEVVTRRKKKKKKLVPPPVIKRDIFS